MIAKFLIWVLKKLHSPTKEQVVLTSVGGLAFLIAFNLFLPGFIPAGVSVKPRYDTSLLPKKHLSRFIFKLWYTAFLTLVLELLSVLHVLLCELVSHQCRQ